MARMVPMAECRQTRRSVRGHSGLLLVLIALALLSTTCSSHDAGGPVATSKVTELSNVSDLQNRFNQDAGAVRLIVLVSPT